MNIWQYVYENDPKENDNLKKENDPKYKYGPKFDKPKNEDNLKKENDLKKKKVTSNIRENSKLKTMGSRITKTTQKIETSLGSFQALCQHIFQNFGPPPASALSAHI